MKILVPTDGSSSALRALKYADKLAADHAKSAVISLSVHDHLGSVEGCAKDLLDDDVSDLGETELKVLRVPADKPSASSETAITAGHVAQEIVKIAESGGFDLIVMGAKGRSPLCDLAMGSVAQKVVGGTRLPVTLVK
jgi:nucleotide-binding universal stress UspA family protein